MTPIPIVHPAARTLLALTTLLTACGWGVRDTTARSHVTDSAGIRIATAPATDVPPPWAPESVCRFGGADRGAESFSRVDQSTVATDGADRIYVLRPETRSVEVFDATCRHLTTLGGPGDGPGELRTPTAIAVTADGEVHVFDAAKQARLRWGRDHAVLSPIPWGGAMSLPNGPLQLEGGRAVFLSARGGGGTMTHLLTALEGERRIDLDSVVNPFPNPAMTRCGMQMLDPVFAPRPVWALRNGRTAFARSDGYEIRLYEGDRLTQVIRRPHPAAAATNEEARRAQPEGERIGSCTIPIEEMITEVGLAPARPKLAAISVDDQQQLWVERWEFPDEAPVTDLYDADGQYRGTFTDLAAPLGSLRGGRFVVPVRDATTDLVGLVVLRGGRSEQ